MGRPIKGPWSLISNGTENLVLPNTGLDIVGVTGSIPVSSTLDYLSWKLSTDIS
jgi:hypothetical protein